MEITYFNKSLIKINADLNHLFSSSLMTSSAESSNNVEIIVNFETSLDSSMVEEINKTKPDILISPKPPTSLFSKFENKSYLNSSIKEKDLIFFELLDNNEDNNKFLNSKTYLIQESGEYEIKNTYIKSINNSVSENQSDLSKIENTESSLNNVGDSNLHIYTIEAEKIKICCFWKIPEKKLSTEQLNLINSIDILIFSYKKEDLNDYSKILNFIKQINPLIIILKNVSSDVIKDSDINGEVLENDSNIKNFIKQIGEERVIFTDKLKVQEKDIAKLNKNFIFLK